MSDKKHLNTCVCNLCQKTEIPEGVSRKNFLRTLGAATMGLGLMPVTTFALNEKGKAEEIEKSNVVKSGKVQHLTLLHTSDIHGQVNVHDEFFWENDKAVFKKRGGFAHLKTAINEIRKKNPDTLLLDGGDCFQGSGLTTLSEGKAIIPLMNDLEYDLVLPGNWEVVYGKQMLLNDMGAYNARKICANMFNDDPNADLLFPPYQTFHIAGIKIGFIGYNDPLTPIRQAPDYNRGIRFTHPEKDLSKYVKILKEQEGCKMVFVMSHMGLTQQIDLASQPCAEGVDYIFGADTHERIREPLAGKYAKVTEPGAFASFVGKLDLVIEDGKIKDESYELIEVDPDKFPADKGMQSLISSAYEPYKKELNRVVGKTRTTLMRYFVTETPMDNLITEALMWKLNSDICIANGFRFCPPLVASENMPSDITKDYLYSMIPGNNNVITADVSGNQILEWMEKELENVFSKDPAKRIGGWLVRFQGLRIKFTIGNDFGKRLQEVTVKGELLDKDKIYKVTSCEREGDPDSLLCRIKNVKNTKRAGFLVHDVLEEYLAKNSPVAPSVEGRAIATDAPATLLTQVKGANYQFR